MKEGTEKVGSSGTQFTWIDTPQALSGLGEEFERLGIKSVAMDLEEESNLHIYGEYVCLVQIFDGRLYYIVDAWTINRTQGGAEALKAFFESPVEKIMFDCSSDAAIIRKTLNSRLPAVYDLRIPALALGFRGSLTGLMERFLGTVPEEAELKKKYQRANWMTRPLSAEQIEYALGDVRYLIQLKEILEREVSKLPVQTRQRISNEMRHCSEPRHRDRPGWEKICNYKALPPRQKIFVKHFFLARDSLARKANVPASNILEKQVINAMARAENWEGLLEEPKLKYAAVFEQARIEALSECRSLGRNFSDN